MTQVQMILDDIDVIAQDHHIGVTRNPPKDDHVAPLINTEDLIPENADMQMTVEKTKAKSL